MNFNLEDAEQVFFRNVVLKQTYREICKSYHIDCTTLCRKMKLYKKFFGIETNERYTIVFYLKHYYGDEIKERYINGESSDSIAKDFDTTDHTITKILDKLGVEIRNVGYPSRFNQDLFKNITNEIEAYTLGLLTADGNVSTKWSVRIFLTQDDDYILKEINERLLNNLGKISVDKRERGKPVSRLGFSGKQICQNLAQYNVVPNKSDKLTDIYILPNSLMHHYIRGLFDGDGICSKSNGRVRFGYCAKRIEFVLSFQNFLCEHLYLRKNKLFNTGGCWQCSWSAKTDIQKFYNYIYKDATIFLGRKKKKMADYLEAN